MIRSTILLPESLKQKAEQVASSRGISLSELIRRQLAKVTKNLKTWDDDPIFAESTTWIKETPEDMSSDHDTYLYGTTVCSPE
mgnify:CR=1 FL=1